MSGTTRKQEYRYQFKTLALQGSRDCGTGGSVNFMLPQNFIAVKNLFVHVRIQFNVAEPSANQKISGIGSKTFSINPANQPLMRPLALTADANREIDLKVDLFDIIPKLAITAPALGNQGYFNIGIQHPNNLSNFATIKLWKIDVIYTTQGIR
jgi:hypothetical protein